MVHASQSEISYELVAFVSHASDPANEIALLRDPSSGDMRYLSASQWRELQAKMPARASSAPPFPAANAQRLQGFLAAQEGAEAEAEAAPQPQLIPAANAQSLPGFRSANAGVEAEVETGAETPPQLSPQPQLQPQPLPPQPQLPQPLQPQVTSKSHAYEKIALYRSLFKGREDVHAQGYLKRATGKINYGPACANKWKPGICALKAGGKCATCAQQRFAPLDDKALIEHFQGKSAEFKDVLGRYVLADDATTWVLVADFDGEGWQAAASAYRDVARAYGLHPAVERSRSGAGAHVWLFFAEPTEAKQARELGFYIITSAMRSTGAASFKSYDRLFPAQDTVQPGGLGSLIALPLQGRACRQGNSMFVDDAFNAFPDQWAYLSSVRKTASAEVAQILSRQTGDPAGELAYADDESPRNRVRKSRNPLPADAAAQQRVFATAPAAVRGATDAAPLPKAISVVKSNGLHVSVAGLPPWLKDRLRRLAVFGNPKFFRQQALHLSVRGTARFICLYDETPDEIFLPRGCEAKLEALLRETGIQPNIRDERNADLPLHARFGLALRPAQQRALDALLRHDNGILSAPTGFGKTVVAAALIARLAQRTLVVVPTRALAIQWRESLAHMLAIDDEPPVLRTKTGRLRKNQAQAIGRIADAKLPESGLVDIATFQSLIEDGEISGTKQAKALINNYGLLICDECHHCAADELQVILRASRARYVYGLSATPRRDDGLHTMIYLQIGPIRHTVDAKAHSAEQGYDRLLEPRLTRIRLANAEPDDTFNALVNKLCQHKARNALIVQDTCEALEAGRTPLVVTRRIEHAKLLADELRQRGATVFLLIGSGTDKDKAAELTALRAHPEGMPFAVVATGSYIGEGFDEPRLDTLMLANPVAGETVVTQYSGRLHRSHAGKSQVLVYDYVDTSIPLFDGMYQKRLRTYRKLGYQLQASPQSENAAAQFVSAAECLKALQDDIAAAVKMVHIEAVYVNGKFVELLLPALENAVARGIPVTIRLKQPCDASALERAQAALAQLQQAGCVASLADDGRFGLAVFDEAKVWYGSLPLLAFGKSDDCSLRFESAEAAHDLMDGQQASSRGACAFGTSAD